MEKFNNNNDKKIAIILILIALVLLLSGCHKEEVNPKSKMIAFFIKEINGNRFQALIEYDGKGEQIESYGIASGKDLFPGQFYRVIINKSNYDVFLMVIYEDGIERERREITRNQIIKIKY